MYVKVIHQDQGTISFEALYECVGISFPPSGEEFVLIKDARADNNRYEVLPITPDSSVYIYVMNDQGQTIDKHIYEPVLTDTGSADPPKKKE